MKDPWGETTGCQSSYLLAAPHPSTPLCLVIESRASCVYFLHRDGWVYNYYLYSLWFSSPCFWPLSLPLPSVVPVTSHSRAFLGFCLACLLLSPSVNTFCALFSQLPLLFVSQLKIWWLWVRDVKTRACAFIFYFCFAKFQKRKEAETSLIYHPVTGNLFNFRKWCGLLSHWIVLATHYCNDFNIFWFLYKIKS